MYFADTILLLSCASFLGKFRDYFKNLTQSIWFLSGIYFIYFCSMKMIIILFCNVQQTRGWNFGRKVKSNVSVDEVAFLCYILWDVFGSILDVFTAITRTNE